MRKGVVFSCFLFVACLLLVGCSENGMEEGTVSFSVISVSSGVPKHIDSNVPMTVMKYVIKGAGPGDASFYVELDAKGSSSEKSNVRAGKWTFTAVALNEEGNAVGEGCASVTVLANKNNVVSFVVKEYEGKGSFSVRLSVEVPCDDMFYLELFKGSEMSSVGEKREFSSSDSSGGGTVFKVSVEGLQNGTYGFSIFKKNSSSLICVYTDSVRIVKDDAVEFDLKYENDEVSEETFSMCVPVFGSGSVEDGSKGLHNLTPEGSPFGDDFWGAAYCIQNLPMFFGVSQMEGLTVSTLKSRLNIEYKVFGLTVSPVLEAWKVNKDGVYLRYRIIEPDFKGYGSDSGEIGYFDYYWNFEEHMFTYREVMALTLKVNGSYSQAPIAVMVIEYDDVKVEMKDGSLCYSIGNVGADGTIEKNGFIDFINVNSAYTNNNEWLFTAEELFDRRYVTAGSKDGLFVSIVHTDNEITTGTMPLKDNEAVSKLVGSICHSSDLLIDTDKEAARFNMAFCWDLLPLYYKNVDDLKKHDPNHEEFVGGYSSYSEYRKTSFEKYSEYVGTNIGQAMEKHYTHNCFNVVFDYMTGNYANECKGEKAFGSFDGKIDSYEKAKTYGYTDIFTSLDESTKGWPYFLFLELFEVCGVHDLNYMKNYSYASSRWGKFNWPFECTNEDHEVFKSKVDNISYY